MAQMGRPPKPNEVKRRTGNPGRRPLPKEGQVVSLPAASTPPVCPDDFGSDAERLWRRAWDAAITWLSPHSDLEAVEQACRLADDLAIARARYRVSLASDDGRLIVALQKQLAASLSSLGFDPVSRTRLGVAEVTRVSKLQKLRERHEA
jgi:hypothetical protein